MKNYLFVLGLGLLSSLSFAQPINNFSLPNVMNGEQVSFETYPSCVGLLVVFTSNECPYDETYRNRIKALANQYKDKVPVILVNPHTDASESVENMVKKGSARGINIPYVADKEQKLMTSLGATKSPQAFLLKNTDGKFTVFYSGLIDDNAQVEADVKHTYVKDAIDALLSNKPVVSKETRPTGCTIRRK